MEQFVTESSELLFRGTWNSIGAWFLSTPALSAVTHRRLKLCERSYYNLPAVVSCAGRLLFFLRGEDCCSAQFIPPFVPFQADRPSNHCCRSCWFPSEQPRPNSSYAWTRHTHTHTDRSSPSCGDFGRKLGRLPSGGSRWRQRSGRRPCSFGAQRRRQPALPDPVRVRQGLVRPQQLRRR